MSKKESKRYPLHYTNTKCVNCGRLRVEKYTDESLICEKCHFNQKTKEYETSELI